MPPLSAADFLPTGIRSVISSLIILVYVGMFPMVIDGFLSLARLSRSTYEWIDQAQVAAWLHANAVAAAIGTAVMLVNLIGLARYAALGGNRLPAALKANACHLLENRSATFRYLIRQLVLLGAAALLILIGNVIGGAISPFELRDYHPENMLVVAWRTLGVFVYSCGFVMVWNASLHLLAQYARESGIHSGDYHLDKHKVDAF